MSEQYFTIEHLTVKDITRIFSKIHVSTEHFYKGSPCWEWTASRSPNGYGQTYLNKERHAAHRLLYAFLVSPVPRFRLGTDLELDHLCRVRQCCNPCHLELVTHQINGLRGVSVAAKYAQRDTCANGHDLSNAPILTGTKHVRSCRVCAATIQNARYQTDAEFAERKKYNARKRAERVKSDPVLLEKARQQARVKSRRRRQDPIIRQAILASAREAKRKRYAEDPEYRERILAMNRAAQQRKRPK